MTRFLSNFAKRALNIPLKYLIGYVLITCASAVHSQAQIDSTPTRISNEVIKETSSSTLRSATDSIIEVQHPLDWVEKSALTPAQRQHLASGCNGRFIDPQNTSKNQQLLNTPPATIPLIIESNTAQVSDNNQAELSGQVVIEHGARTITANQLRYNKSTDIGLLEGEVTIRQPGVRINGESAVINATDNSAVFNNASFVMHEKHLNGAASSIEQTKDNQFIMQNGTMTSCEPGARGWKLQGKELRINPNTQQGIGKNVQLKVANIPILYIPYITFPVGDKRQSGFLAPNVGTSDGSGIDLTLPYYWNIAPHMDATIAPRLLTGRGLMLELETRHLNHFFETEFHLGYLPNDKDSNDDDLERRILNGEIPENLARPNRGEDRWLAGFSQQGSNKQAIGWYSNIHFNRTSDINYLRDFGSSFRINNQTYLNRQFTAGYRWQHWQSNITVQDYQLLLLDLDAPYRRAPEVNFDGYYSWGGTWGDITLSQQNQFIEFKNDQQTRFNGTDIITGKRLYNKIHLTYNKHNSWGFFEPSVGLNALNYKLDKDALIPSADDSAEFYAAEFSLNTGLIFENTQRSLTQTIEPRIFYNFREDVDQTRLLNVTNDGQDVNFDTQERTFSYEQLYRNSRFSGYDRLDDANSLTIGITKRWLDPDQGDDMLSARRGQIFHFDDRDVSLDGTNRTEKKSELAAEMSVKINRLSRIQASVIFDTAGQKIQRGTAGWNYQRRNQKSGQKNDYSTIMNLSYSYLRQAFITSSGLGDIDQVDLNFITDINSQWNLFGRYNYDFAFDQELEAFIGLEYDDCCYSFRLLARRWLDSNIAAISDENDVRYDQGLFFEIHFKGLGGSGKKIQSILSDSIVGYKQRLDSDNR